MPEQQIKLTVAAYEGLAKIWADTIERVCFPSAYGEATSGEKAELYKIREQLLEQGVSADVAIRR